MENINNEVTEKSNKEQKMSIKKYATLYTLSLNILGLIWISKITNSSNNTILS